MAAGKHISLLIVPEDGSPIINLRLRRSVFRFLKGLAVGIILLVPLAAVSYWKFFVVASQNRRLRVENEELRSKAEKVATLAQDLERIKAARSQLRAMLGGEVGLLEEGYSLGGADTSGAMAFSKGDSRGSRLVPFIWPAAGKVSAEFGERRGLLGGKHEGIDIAAPQGTPVYATADGEVIFAGWTDDMGNLVIIKHGDRFSTRYGHNQKLLVKKGQYVRKGEQIALVGNSGRSTAPHLHYEVWDGGKAVNPRKFLPER